MIDRIINSDTPSRVFVQCMDDRGEISPTDISEFIDALEHKTVGLKGVAAKVKEAFELHAPIVHSTAEKKGNYL